MHIRQMYSCHLSHLYNFCDYELLERDRICDYELLERESYRKVDRIILVMVIKGRQQVTESLL